ncbi:MAG: sodium:alanine symporter family protein, partial [Verrucomicrobia bacterium]|nr:sodium:alanine symporter family protein [Verrucomicrobiota bacterium]
MSLRSLLSSKQEGTGSISSYQAIASVIAGNLGTGNISGMAVALTTGGPG